MSKPVFHIPDEPSASSVGLLTISLRSDCERKGVSSKNYAHRARVIRQQTELLNRRSEPASEEAATNLAHVPRQ